MVQGTASGCYGGPTWKYRLIDILQSEHMAEMHWEVAVSIIWTEQCGFQPCTRVSQGRTQITDGSGCFNGILDYMAIFRSWVCRENMLAFFSSWLIYHMQESFLCSPDSTPSRWHHRLHHLPLRFPSESNGQSSPSSVCTHSYGIQIMRQRTWNCNIWQ